MVSCAMAAGMACVGSLVELPPCCRIVSSENLVCNASTYDHGVQSGTGEGRGTDEVFGGREEGFEISLVSEGDAI